jgi:hypothetical protein
MEQLWASGRKVLAEREAMPLLVGTKETLIKIDPHGSSSVAFTPKKEAPKFHLQSKILNSPEEIVVLSFICGSDCVPFNSRKCVVFTTGPKSVLNYFRCRIHGCDRKE